MDERNWRPVTLDDFVGQSRIKATLGLMLNSAQIQGTSLEHICFYGGPGLGKTTLAAIIATEMHAQLREVSAPSVERLGDLVSILVGLQERDVLFLDEIHRLRPEIAETLYSAMEDFRVSIPVKGGTSEGSLPITMPVHRCTIVGATTDFGMLPEPLRARFGHLFALELYSPEELYQVVMRAADKAGVLIDRASAQMIANRARGTPRIALRLFRRVVDMAITVEEDVTELVTQQAMDLLQVDDLGLEESDRRYLTVMANVYKGGPVGPKSIAASCGFDEATITEAIEPWLLRAGLIARTRNGRRMTRQGWEHTGAQLGLQIPIIGPDFDDQAPD